jgi:hypothetical protein
MLFRLSALLLSTVPLIGAHDSRAQASRELAADYELIGIVTDISSVPIPEVEVSIVKPTGFGKRVLTAKDGKFLMAGIPAGAVSVQARRIGYEARVIEVQMTTSRQTSVEIMLKPVPKELEDLIVKSDDVEALREFYDRKKRLSSYAKFFDQTDVRKRGATYPSDLFRSIPGVQLASTGYVGNAVRIRGCHPMLWVDGARIPNSEVDEVIAPADIAGIEFYMSMAGTPAQYLDRSTRACGTILVWTRNR